MRKQRALGFEYISQTIAKIVPKVIDLTNSGDEDDAMEEKITGLDEDEKNICLRVFFKYLKSNRTKLQVREGPPVKEKKKQDQNDTKQNDDVPREEENILSDEAREDSREYKKEQKKKKRFGCRFIEYEAGCSDKLASSDEHTDEQYFSRLRWIP